MTTEHGKKNREAYLSLFGSSRAINSCSFLQEWHTLIRHRNDVINIDDSLFPGYNIRIMRTF